MSRLFLIIGILLLLATEILRVYFIMPFPGSQQSNTIDLAYFIEKYKWILRIIGIITGGWTRYTGYSTGGKIFPKIFFRLVVVLYRDNFLLFQFPV